MSLPQVTVWSGRESTRLRYVLDWLLQERLGLSYELTSDESQASRAPYSIAYGGSLDLPGIYDSGLLWETGLTPRSATGREWQGLHTLFFDEQSDRDIQFDMLSGIFYLLSRYEEYSSFAPDRHNRYPAEQSALFEVLQRPIVDEWVEALRLFLEQSWNVSLPQKSFQYQPSYDIDIAWSYRFKGFKRTIGAALREALSMNWSALRGRLSVMQGKKEDPYDSFVFLLGEHMMDDIRPIYFILAALQSSPFDKNIPPTHPRMSALINALGQNSIVGLHPSYYSDTKEGMLIQEKAILERITHKPVSWSRQHYIKLRFPDTYRALIAAGIEEDWSMGYSTHIGFRAGTSHSFLWYDLEHERVTSLRVHPFAFMDSTAHYDLGLPAAEAFTQLRNIAANLKACGGKLVTIMHNYSLGSDPEWAGWRSEYQRFLAEHKTG